MSSSENFSFRNIIKVLLITLSILFWMYFFTSSNVNLDILIIFDVPSILNTFLTLNFLLFLLIFPITSSLIVAYSYNGALDKNMLVSGIGIFLGAVLSFIFFKLSFGYFIFFILYFLVHLAICFLTKNKYENEPKKSIFDTANTVSSKLSLFLTIVLFIVLFILILPNQQEKALIMEAGVVNLFVGDDLSNWLGTSLSISNTCTKQNLEQIIEQPQYKALEQKTDKESIDFTKLMDSYYDSVTSGDTDISEFANLDTVEIKDSVLQTIRSIPMMVIMEEYFAFVFSFILISFAYLYFSIAFGIIGVLFVVLFKKIIDISDGEKDSPIKSKKDPKDFLTNLKEESSFKKEENKISLDNYSNTSNSNDSNISSNNINSESNTESNTVDINNTNNNLNNNNNNNNNNIVNDNVDSNNDDQNKNLEDFGFSQK